MKKLLIILALAFLLLPLGVMAAEPASPTDFYPLIQCGTAESGVPCTPCDLFVEFDRIINFIVFGVTGPIAVFMIILSGGMILLGAGNTTVLAKGKDLFKSTILGVTVILLSWVATTFLLQSLTGGDTAWYEVSCPSYLSDIEIPQDLTVLPIGGQVQPYTPVEVPDDIVAVPQADIVGARIDLCPVTAPKAGCGKCPKYRDFIQKYAGGAATAGLIESIMFYESSCNIKPPPSGAGAYGLMQMKPETANQFREGCVKPNPETGKIEDMPINGGWLMSEKHAEESICIAAKFINSLVGQCGTNPRNLAAGYNGGGGACRISRDCADIKSCTEEPMRAWECPYDNKEHTRANTGYNETRAYAPKVAICAK